MKIHASLLFTASVITIADGSMLRMDSYASDAEKHRVLEAQATKLARGFRPSTDSRKLSDKMSKTGKTGKSGKSKGDDKGHRRYLEADHETANRKLIGFTDKEEIELFMKQPLVDRHGNFLEKANLLSTQECELLMDYLDAESSPSNDKQSEEFQIRDRIISATELIDLIGEEKTQGLLDMLYEAAGEKALVRKVWLRRVDNDGSVGNYVDFHTDHKHSKYLQSTMVVALNSEDDIEGGEIFYLNEDGPIQGFRAQGKAFAHKYDVYHGVAPHKGTRVSLLIHLDHDPAPGIEDLLEGTSLN